jgi:hypothetical protein
VSAIAVGFPQRPADQADFKPSPRAPHAEGLRVYLASR